MKQYITNIKSIVITLCLMALPTITWSGPDIATALSDLNMHYLKYNNPTLAQKYKDLALQAGSGRVWYTYACEYAKKGDIKRARECLEKLPAGSDDGIFIVTAILDNNIEQAMSYVLAQHPSESRDHLYDIVGAAQICSHFGRYDYAEMFYQKALAWADDQSLSFFDADSLELHRDIAKLYKKQGKRTDALLHQFAAFNDELDVLKKLEDVFATGKIYYAHGEFAPAISLIGPECLDNQPGIDKYRALIYAGLGDLDQCKNSLSKIYITFPEVLELSTLRSFIQEQKKISQEAELLLELGLAYMQTKEYKTALCYLEHAQSLFDTVYVKESLDELPKLHAALVTTYTQLKQHKKAQVIQKKIDKK